MRDVERIDKICNALRDIWKEYPDWRFTQLLSNFNICGDRRDYISFYQEDDETYKRIHTLYYELKTL